MADILFPFAGGLGLFLVGMMLLSQGLVAFGGHALKQALARFTGTPGKAEYLLTDGTADRTKAASAEMLAANPLYPGLEL